jgi:hypothetical protein
MKLDQEQLDNINKRIRELLLIIENHKLNIKRNLKKFQKTKAIKYADNVTKSESEIIKKQNLIKKYEDLMERKDESTL